MIRGARLRRRSWPVAGPHARSAPPLLLPHFSPCASACACLRCSLMRLRCSLIAEPSPPPPLPRSSAVISVRASQILDVPATAAPSSRAGLPVRRTKERSGRRVAPPPPCSPPAPLGSHAARGSAHLSANKPQSQPLDCRGMFPQRAPAAVGCRRGGMQAGLAGWGHARLAVAVARCLAVCNGASCNLRHAQVSPHLPSAARRRLRLRRTDGTVVGAAESRRRRGTSSPSRAVVAPPSRPPLRLLIAPRLRLPRPPHMPQAPVGG
jgi:hypothetical protein